MTTEAHQPLFHGKFIPDDPHPLPLLIRLMIGAGLGLVILVFAFVCMDTLNSWGVWVTLMMIATMTASSLGLWIRDARRHPATKLDEREMA